MTDSLTPERRSENMRRIRSSDTKPELMVRRLVYSMGYRYRLHAKELPGKPDLVFRNRKAVIFVHGCFWHLHSGCREGRIPSSNAQYWEEKLLRNALRDQQYQKELIVQGWRVLIIWECETDDPKSLYQRLREFLDNTSRERLR